MARVDKIIQAQTYPDIEHIYLWGEGTIGDKRNRACQQAKGEIILHIDSDDLYSADWVEKQVNLLQDTGSDICGLSEIYFLSETEAWRYRWSNATPWVAGATLCYRKAFWETHPFRDIQVAEDYYFLDGAKVVAGDYTDRFIATLHEDNTAPHRKSTNWHKMPHSEIMTKTNQTLSFLACL